MDFRSQKGVIDVFLQTLIVIAAIIGFLVIMQRDSSVHQLNNVASSTWANGGVSSSLPFSEIKKTERAKGVEIVYTSKGFIPRTITLTNKERTIIVRNQSGKRLQIASYPHPTHTDFTPLNQKGYIRDGESYIFVFTEARRVYQFHNELKPEHDAVVIAD